MSTLITIGIKLDSYTFKVSLKMLLDRITSQAKIHSVRLKEGYEYSEHTYLSAHHDKIYENSLIPLDKTNAAVEFRLELLGEMGNNFFVDLHHYGKDFHRGSRYLEDSPISIKINQSQFQQPLGQTACCVYYHRQAVNAFERLLLLNAQGRSPSSTIANLANPKYRAIRERSEDRKTTLTIDS